MSGKEISLYANFFKIENVPTKPILQFAIKAHFMDSSKPLKFIDSVVGKVLEHCDFKGAFDGKAILYSFDDFPGIKREAGSSRRFLVDKDGVHEGGEPTEGVSQIAVDVGLSSVLQLSSPALKQALNVFLKQGKPYCKNILVNMDKQFALGRNLIIHPGIITSVFINENTSSYLLNADCKPVVYYNEVTVDEYVKNCSLQVASKELHGVTLRASYRGQARKFKFCGFSKELAKDITFKKEAKPDENAPEGEVEMTEETMLAYLETQYGFTSNCGHLPAVKVHPKKDLFVPLDGVIVEKQPFTKMVKDIRDMRRVTCVKPQQRRRDTEDLCLQLKDSMIGKISPKMIRINGRILPPVKIEFAKKQMVEARDGSIQVRPLYRQSELVNWAIISFTRADLDEFARGLRRELEGIGMRVERPITKIAREREVKQELLALYKEMRQETKPQLIVCVLPNKTTPIYMKIKKLTEMDSLFEDACVTQCIVVQNLRKKNCFVGLGIKMNLKCRKLEKVGDNNNAVSSAGMNWKVPKMTFISERPTMIVGADVYHGGKEDRTDAVASMVATVNGQFTKYCSTMEMQERKEEQLISIKKQMVKLLKGFKAETKYPLERLIFYRDGVGEGQFEMCIEQEVQGIKDALQEEGFDAKITFIVLQKRHNARFYPIDAGDRKGNCRAVNYLFRGPLLEKKSAKRKTFI